MKTHTMKVLFKKILLAINPVYRKINSNQEQLKYIQKMLENMEINNQLRLENQQKIIENMEINNQLRLENQQKIIENINNVINYQYCNKDETYIHSDVPPVEKAHISYFTKTHNKKGKRILEIGSRDVTGNNKFRHLFPEATYVGFDYYAGENVDVVGDAHKLSTYFDINEKFDVIFSYAVFEHFAMPWIVAEEIDKLIKINGYVLTATHFSFSSHERPWNFFQFSDMGLRALFSPAMGYQCIDAGMGNSIIGRFSSLMHDENMRNKPVTGLYCSAHCLCKKIKDVKDFEWDKINLSEVVEDTKYPEM